MPTAGETAVSSDRTPLLIPDNTAEFEIESVSEAVESTEYPDGVTDVEGDAMLLLDITLVMEPDTILDIDEAAKDARVLDASGAIEDASDGLLTTGDIREMLLVIPDVVPVVDVEIKFAAED